MLYKSEIELGNKEEVEQELKLRYREYFEGKLAKLLIRHAPLFNSIKKISQNILLLLSDQDNCKRALNTIEANSKIQEDLYQEGRFGRFEEKATNAKAILNAILLALKQELKNETITQILQIHSVFIYRLYDKLTNKTLKSSTENLINKSSTSCNFFANGRNRVERKPNIYSALLQLTNTSIIDLPPIKLYFTLTSDHKLIFFNFKEKKRLEIKNTTIPTINVPSHFLLQAKKFNLQEKEYVKLRTELLHIINHSPSQAGTLTKQYGFCGNPVFAKRIGNGAISHYRAVDRFKCTLPLNKTIPTVASHSGHTSSLLLGAQLYGQLTEAEMQEYTFACFAFLALGGNHSFYEVMSVAETFGLPFKEGDYATSIPDSLKDGRAYQQLCEEFPEFLTNKQLNRLVNFN